jgi:coatomer subunit alpha
LSAEMEEIFMPKWTAAELGAEPDYLEAVETEEESVIGEGWGNDDEDLNLLPGVTGAGTVGGIGGLTIEERVAKRLGVDFVWAGEFEQALDWFKKRIDLINPAPLHPLFLQIYTASRATLPNISPFLGALTLPIYEKTSDGVGILPKYLYTAETQSTKYQNALKLVSQGKFLDAYNEFLSILTTLTVSAASSDSPEADEKTLKDLLDHCREYLLAMMIELTRRDTSDTHRSLELGILMALCKMEQQTHSFLATKTSMIAQFKAENYITAAFLAKRIINTPLTSNKEAIDMANKVLVNCEAKGTEAYPMSFEYLDDLGICAGSLTKITRSDAVVKCPYCFAIFKEPYKGHCCSVCKLSRIGGKALGMQFR